MAVAPSFVILPCTRALHRLNGIASIHTYLQVLIYVLHVASSLSQKCVAREAQYESGHVASKCLDGASVDVQREYPDTACPRACKHTFLGLLAKIKCSICSYQFNR